MNQSLMELSSGAVDILLHLTDVGYATADELQVRFSSKSTMKKALTTLLKDGFIETYYLGDFLRFHERSEFLNEYFSKSRKIVFYRLSPLKFPSAYIVQAEIKHDLIVSMLLKQLRSLFPDASCINEKRLKRVSTPALLPDIVVIGDSFKLAIEFERTPKNSIRYLERFRNYDSSEYTHVLFICGNEGLLKAIHKLGKHFSFIGISTLNDPFLVESNIFGSTSITDFTKIKCIKGL